MDGSSVRGFRGFARKRVNKFMDCCEDMEHMTEHHAHHEEHKTHGAHNAHSGHGNMGMGHGSATDFLRRFWIVTALLVPLALTNGSVAGLFHIPEFAFGKWIAFGLATIIFGFSLVFFRHAWHEIKMHAYGMMTLVSLAVGAGYLFSVASTFIPSLNDEFYLEIGTLVWVLLFGHYLEARSGAAAGVFSVWGFFLRPEIGALVMSLSTVIVVANAVSLRRINLEHVV